MRVVLTLGLALLAGCASREAPDRPTGPPLSAFTPAEVEQQARKLLERLEVEPEVRRSLLERVRAFLASRKQEPVNAVGAYHLRAGGIGLRVSAGGGLVSFAGGSGARPFKGKSLVVGMVAGVDSIRGVCLVTGLRQEPDLPGSYRIETRELASGPLRGHKVGLATPKWEAPHRVHMLGHSEGLAAGTGVGSGTITFADRPPRPSD